METDNKEELFNVLVIANEIDEIDQISKTMKYAVIPMTKDDYAYFKQAHGYIYGEGDYFPDVEQAGVDLAAALCKSDTTEAWCDADRVRSWRKYVTLTSDIRNVDYIITIEFI